jgi:hypothetical protein
MTRTRRAIHAAFLFAMPIIVAWFGLNVFTSIGIVVLMLFWRWAIVWSGLFAPEKTPGLVLETITGSHFVEKVRWCMDRLGVAYTEQQSAGVFGVLFTGRTVPRLKVKTGIVQSTIGNSPEILRYLWGANYADHREKASFLEPTKDRLELERRIDRYARHLQVWVYYHILADRKIALHAWGANAPQVPVWQRVAVSVLFPLQAAFIKRTFAINKPHYDKVVSKIEGFLSDIEMLLADGRQSILGNEQNNYTDLAFASATGLWLQPDAYGGGQAEFARLERDRLPEKMRYDIERWIEDHPKATELVERLYAEER